MVKDRLIHSNMHTITKFVIQKKGLFYYLKHYKTIKEFVNSYKQVELTYKELTKDNEINIEFTN